MPGELAHPVELGYQVLLDGKSVIHRISRELPPEAADLIEIASTVYAVDQMVGPSREEQQLDSGASWAREVQLEIPVRLPGVWITCAGSLLQGYWPGLLMTAGSWCSRSVAQGASGPLDAPQGFLFDHDSAWRGTSSVLWRP